MQLQAHNKALYLSVLTGAGFLFLAALGPGLLGARAPESFGSWQYQIFELLCHQDPARSFNITGVQMAVCSRCISIYGFFFFGMVSMPVFARFKPSLQKEEINWLIAAILLNLADVIGNYFGIWSNTHISRFLLGGAFGITLALILTNEFFTLNKSE